MSFCFAQVSLSGLDRLSNNQIDAIKDELKKQDTKQVEETNNIIIDGLRLVLLVGVASVCLQNGMVLIQKMSQSERVLVSGKESAPKRTSRVPG